MVGPMSYTKTMHSLLSRPHFFITYSFAEGDNFTTEFYENPVSIGDFEKHCAQRRKYPVLLQIEFNNAIKEVEVQVSSHNVIVLDWDFDGNHIITWWHHFLLQPTRKGTLKANVEKNQNPRVVPCKKKIFILFRPRSPTGADGLRPFQMGLPFGKSGGNRRFFTAGVVLHMKRTFYKSNK